MARLILRAGISHQLPLFMGTVLQGLVTVQSIALDQTFEMRLTWPFILADVKTPLLGADFLQANGLLVDLQSKRLVNATSFASSLWFDAKAVQPNVTRPSPRHVGRPVLTFT